MKFARAILEVMLPTVMLLISSVANAAELSLICPCSIYASGEADSTESPTAMTITAGVANASVTTTAPLRLQVVASPDAVGSSSRSIVYAADVRLAPLGGNQSLPAQRFRSGFRSFSQQDDAPLYFTLELQEFTDGFWRRRDRVRMQGRARQGNQIAEGGRLDFSDRQWYGLVVSGPVEAALEDSSFTINLPGLTNVSSLAVVEGNLILQIRQANTSGSYFTVATELTPSLSIAAGASAGDVQVSGALGLVNNEAFGNLYFVIRDEEGREYLRLDLPDDSDPPSKRYIDLQSIDFVADSDDDGVSDYQERLALADEDDPDDTPAPPNIRVLFYHSPSVAADLGGDIATGVIHLLESTNQMYAQSGIDLRLELAAIEEVNLDEQQSLGSMLGDMRRAEGEFASLDATRVGQLADLVFGLKSASELDGFCGIATLSGSESDGDFAAVSDRLESSVVGTARSDCGASTVAHELGHMMGLGHSRPQVAGGDVPGAFPWGVGHGEAAFFYTMMSYANPWPGASSVNLFSNPEVTCRDEDYEFPVFQSPDFALPCGVDRSDPVNGADSARALNMVGYQVAAFTQDTDGDGTANLFDDDDDGDGSPDDEDEAPLDALSTTDYDLDGIGDARDPDDDNDGVPDSADALPRNRLEQLDTDGDGIGNYADPDDDGDGWSDVEELAEGSNPTDNASIPEVVTGLPLWLLKAGMDRQSTEIED